MITGLKFKSEIKHSGIEFKSIHFIKNLVSGDFKYILSINDDRINFNSKEEFINKFVGFLLKSLDQLESEFNDLNDNPRDYIHLSESDIYYKHEEIGSYMSKQNKLLKKLEKLKDDI